MYVKGDNVVIGLDCDTSLSVVDKFLEKNFSYSFEGISKTSRARFKLISSLGDFVA